MRRLKLQEDNIHLTGTVKSFCVFNATAQLKCPHASSMSTITLNEKQRRRWEIITRLIAKKISNNEASELLDRSSRQVRRMRQRYEAPGLETLIHGNQGRPSPRVRSQLSSSN